MYTYHFREIDACNMCGARAATARVLGRRLNTRQGIRPTRRVAIATTVLRCRDCGLIFANPMPVPVDLSQHYGKPPEDYWRPSYFEENDGYFDAQIDTFFGLWHGDRSPVALDVGAGLGKAMVALERRGFEAHGIEPGTEFHKAALELTPFTEERLQLATVEEVEYPPNHFDFVTFGAVLEHLQDPAAAIERALAWTVPGGLVHAEVPSGDWLGNRGVDLLYRAQGLDYSAHISPMHTPYHLFEFTLTSFQRHAKRAGYRVAGHRRYVAETFLPRPLARIGARLMAMTRTGMQLEVWLRAEAVGSRRH